MKMPMLVLIVLAALVGCGGSSDTPVGEQTSAEPTPTSPAVEKDASYGSVMDLRDAAIEAGLPCPNWKQTDVVEGAAESGTCSGDSVLATFATDQDLQHALDNLRSMQQLFEKQNLPFNPVLVGPNWTVNASNSDQLQTVLGGTVLR